MAELALIVSAIALAVSVKALLAMKRIEARYHQTYSYARPLAGLSESEKQRIWQAVQDTTNDLSANQYTYEKRS